tara:strand:- start:2071 stop:2379 length:309 start_codon:yes stop_codon:yes gene_type:complete
MENNSWNDYNDNLDSAFREARGLVGKYIMIRYTSHEFLFIQECITDIIVVKVDEVELNSSNGLIGPFIAIQGNRYNNQQIVLNYEGFIREVTEEEWLIDGIT